VRREGDNMTATGSDASGAEELERSEQLIDEAKDAAPEALSDTPPAEHLDVPATGTGLDEEGQEVTPRPN
jgi:hypothetical protein